MTTTTTKINQNLQKKSILRDPVSGLTHLGAAIAALIGLIVMLVMGWGDTTKEISLLVYGLSLIGMFSASATYHMVNSGPGVIKWLRKIDHSAIYLLIAGTYTPICLNFFTGFWSWGLLIIIWAMAVIGVTVKLFVINAPRWVTAGIYLIMGWLSIMAVQEMLRTMPGAAIFWLVMGGVLFTLGAIIYMTKKPDPWPGVFGFHEIWHIFVILGCLAHFIVIAVFIAPV
ncbi:MAG TPA: hemolysin III family protein [Anaerolineaceae bacterium]|nr:hemolysin III family protein [Anaerolineaceae bacterium]HPN52448.1 hemolysin III family protein [Anaerolineaceae bacterium]